jgi:hypothetical protein
MNAVSEFRSALVTGRRYFCITHSDRPAQLDQCDLNYLELRFSRPDRLPPAKAFHMLPPASSFTAYGGEVTIHDLGESGREAPKLVARLRPQSYKPQHAIWHSGRLWVLGEHQIEIYGPRLEHLGSVEDPWLAGAHTMMPDGKGRLLVSCSASDSVLIIDESTLTVTDALRLPESLYGRNYPLERSDSVVDHYVSNDEQLTHVNCASPWRGGILVSTLIQGAIGWFDREGGYSELVRGFVGCHGARANSAGEVYFCDSCVGTLMLLDGNMRPRRRIGTDSKWLHDAVEIDGDLYALALYDRRQVRFVDVVARDVVGMIDCEPYGAPQFLGYR